MQRVLQRRWSLGCTLAVLAMLSGCRLHRNWRPPLVLPPAEHRSTAVPFTTHEAAEQSYAKAFQLEAADRPECVDEYYRAATWAWLAVEESGGAASPAASRSCTLYRSALTKLLVAAHRFDRWDSRRGLLVAGPAGLAPVSASYRGFAWSPCDFNQLVPVGEYSSPELSHQYRSNGLGVPLVVIRRSATTEGFLQREQPFAATVVLRPTAPIDDELTGAGPPTLPFRLEFYNPLHAAAATPGEPTPCHSPVPIARDLTAPLAYRTRNADQRWLQAFLRPGAGGSGDGLFMIEPYQRGKIPVVFVHGLLSDPQTWTDMANELRAQPDLVEGCQLWGFHYDTGEPFFESAAVLRRQLRQIRAVYDPQGTDPAMAQMVLVGHSLGGLVSKLQVVHSGDQLWNSVAGRPLSQIHTREQTRARLAAALFFDPNPNISRVIFIGTPHQGSNLASRTLGRLGSALVEPPAQTEQRHRQLIDDNPGVFSEELVRRFPTSIDLLEPDSPLLRATAKLPFRDGVAFHSVCGVIDKPGIGGPTDGVVPLHSARLIGACSEKRVDSFHTRLTRSPATVHEVTRILRLHLRETMHSGRMTAQRGA